MQNYSEGHSIYEFYTYHFEGVDQLTGTSLYTLDPEQKVKAEEAGALVNINGQDYATATSYAQCTPHCIWFYQFCPIMEKLESEHVVHLFFRWKNIRWFL